jgi:hypothetical protein
MGSHWFAAAVSLPQFIAKSLAKEAYQLEAE